MLLNADLRLWTAAQVKSHTHAHTNNAPAFIPSNLIYTVQITSSALNQRLKLETSLNQGEISI